MKPADRIQGFAPIGDYAVIGDGRTIALVASDGRMDWWPAPSLDAPPVAAAILDPDKGGYIKLAPTDPFDVTRRYIDDTNVLETTFATDSGRVAVTQGLNSGAAGRLPWTEIAFRAQGLEGEVELLWEMVSGNRFGQAKPYLRVVQGAPVVKIGDQYLAVIAPRDARVSIDGDAVRGRCRVGAGRRAIWALAATDAEPLFMPRPEAVDVRLDRTVADWRRWTSELDVNNPWAPEVRRSALALKTLLCEETGAIAAAGTTSLPECIGGVKNWDYRYAWVRDSSFTVGALIRLNLHEEAHGAVSWLLRTLRRNGGDLHVFYSLSGEMADEEQELDVPGYRHSRPVRAGNSASGQSQLGTYGDLFDTMWRYCEEGHVLDDGTAEMLATMAQSCCDKWLSRDSGIWELYQLEHYTVSKIGCWVALDRAARLARAGQMPDRHCDRWEHESAEIRRWVDEHCWSDSKQSYTFYAGTERLDAAVALAGRTGFDRGPRLASTLEAICDELMRGPYVYRYSGMQDEEGAFVACTFWLVEAFVHAGQIERATQLMDSARVLANDVGILSEQADPRTGQQLGNVPQALSHLALINAAYAIEHAARAV